MPISGQKRTRSERVAALGMLPTKWERALSKLGRRDVLLRIAMAVAAAAALCLVVRGWDPPFTYRVGYVPQRDIIARVEFQTPDEFGTEEARRNARRQVRFVYVHDPERLEQLRHALCNTVAEMVRAESLAELARGENPKGSPKGSWKQFSLPVPEGVKPPTQEEQEKQFQAFRSAIKDLGGVPTFRESVAAALSSYERDGLLRKLAHDRQQGNQEEIRIRPKDSDEEGRKVPIRDVLIGDGAAIRDRLREQLPVEVADRVFAWLQPQLPETLALDAQATGRAQEQAAAAVPEKSITRDPGDTLARAGEPIGEAHLALLRQEYEVANAARPLARRFARASAFMLVILGMMALAGVYGYHRQRGLLARLKRLGVMLAGAVLTVALAVVASSYVPQAEIVPPLIFGMTVAIANNREVALLVTGIVALVLALGIGTGLTGFLLLMGTATVAILLMDRIRTRSKLIYVGLAASAAAVALCLIAGVLDGQPLSLRLLADAGRSGLWALAAGFLMKGLLPFLERAVGVLTDLSLLELGDMSHPLLQELVRRAPSTYNHSINVAVIGEAAADRIGARGLLVRVGAYFHDIGKMLKPGYFIENQSREEGNRHEALVPAMSSLVIAAHVKDGIDLARQHRLPQAIIDFIEQHHGTWLMEFFYERATEQKEANPDSGEIDESAYRYPGPKPQTKEAGVMMLADAVESASRSLVEPTPARLESLVRDIAEKRLRDGQFDESGLTLRELRVIQDSLVKSLTAVYHGRIKYPDQKTA